MKTPTASTMVRLIVLLGIIAFVSGMVMILNSDYKHTNRSEKTNQKDNAQYVPESTTETTYRNVEDGYEVTYPAGMTIETSTTDDVLGAGTSFMFPMSHYEGTNLSDDSRVHIEVLNNDGSCLPEDFTITENQNVEPMPQRAGSNLQWKGVFVRDAGAGNYYEEVVYAAQAGDTCYGMTLFVHSTSIANYDTETVDIRAYDAMGLQKIFNDMMDSLKPIVS